MWVWGLVISSLRSLQVILMQFQVWELLIYHKSCCCSGWLEWSYGFFGLANCSNLHIIPPPHPLPGKWPLGMPPRLCNPNVLCAAWLQPSCPFGSPSSLFHPLPVLSVSSLLHSRLGLAVCHLKCWPFCQDILRNPNPGWLLHPAFLPCLGDRRPFQEIV